MAQRDYDFDDPFPFDEGPGKKPLAPPPKYIPPEEQAKVLHQECCPKCNGTGRWGWSNRQCFTCKGTGKVAYKTSSAQRAKGKVSREQRKVRTAQENWNAFKAACPMEAEWITSHEEWFEFAAKMREAVQKYGELTEGQLAAVRSCMQRDAERAKQRARITVDASKVECAFATAREKAARPGAQGIWTKPLTLRAGIIDLTFRPGSIGSQWEGMIFVKAGDKKLGQIKGGIFTGRRECSPEEAEAVKLACEDPAKAAIAYGKAWSTCAVCHRTLTNDESIARGIGPICAETMGF